MVLAAVGQICSTASMAHNLSQCRILVQKAVAAGAKTLFLPEASDYIASSPSESLSLCRPASQSEFVQGLQSLSRQHKLPINVGVHEPSDSDAQGNVAADQKKKMKNTLLWIDEMGEIVQRYQKVHLFDVEIENGPILRESDSTEAGNKLLPPFSTPVGKVGLMICFDLRFPEPSLHLHRLGATLLTYPSAFTVPTGLAHWSPLLRARAIETQSYVIAAAQCGPHNEKRVSYGHSMVVSPWGEVVGELGGEWKGEPELLVCDVDAEKVESVRRGMPLKRRWDVYAEV
ncbi:nitrilase [Aulographum hederae CBS 113979]|uniref:Nitrilase n=1 Tax=Aulographum hederae CBS 113979 TaxID=1176131 RepID=A0A6G1H8X2_9PEZI|nr:nitrilase [Aulographum hederae CBS 113979]